MLWNNNNNNNNNNRKYSKSQWVRKCLKKGCMYEIQTPSYDKASHWIFAAGLT